MSTTQKIVLIGNFLPDRQESMLRFEKALTEGFSAMGLSTEVWRPMPRFARLAGTYRYGGIPKYLGYIDKFVLFPRVLKRRSRGQPTGTVFHLIDHSNAIYAKYLPASRQVVTVHDLLQIRSALGEFPLNRLSRSGCQYQNWILKSLRTLPRAACISQKTRSDLMRLAAVPAEKIDVVLNGLNHPYVPVPPENARSILAAALQRHRLTWPAGGASFLFGIGGAQWYKNRDGLLTIFGELQGRLKESIPLLYVGPPFDKSQDALITSLQLKNRLLRIPSLTNEELQAAYSLASGLLFPSWEEGFGWPIAEAQACGCPVFTSGRAPMTEVGGSAAVYFDPADPAAAAEVIARGLALRENMRAAGLENARRWAPQVMLDAYLKIYDSLSAPSAP